jgi:hypothetical protein
MATLKEILRRVEATGLITIEDTRAVRRCVYGGAGPSEDMLAMLFRLEEAASWTDLSWDELLCEAAVDCLLRQAEPHDEIDRAKSDWLVERISTDGRVRTARELEALVRVLEEATSVPTALAVFALRQVRVAVVDGEGPLAADPETRRGLVNHGEAELLRRILTAAGGRDRTGISRAEAEVIFDIHDASAGADNDPAWNELFLKAVTNCIMAASGYAAPPRAVALAAEEEGAAAAVDLGDLVAELCAGSLRAIIEAYDHGRPAAAPAAGADDAEWLAQRIARGGAMGESEKALIRFIRDEAPRVHPALLELVAEAA